MTLPLLRLVAGAVDDEDRYRRLIEARDAEADLLCPHGWSDVDDCGACWIEDDARWKRGQDR